MVKIKILNETEEKIQILLSKTDRSFANALRRSLISDTPKMAIDLSLIHISEPTRLLSIAYAVLWL